MGDASFNKGGVATRNLKAGSATTAKGSVSVSFDRAMKNGPEVVLVSQSADTGNVYVSAKSQNGFTITDSAGAASAEVSWIAFNDDRA